MHCLDIKIKSGYFSVAEDEGLLLQIDRISHCTNQCKYICIYLYKDVQITVAKPVESACRVIYIYTTLIGALCGGQFCSLGKS